MSELNPNHPVTRALSLEWHKLCAIVMLKAGLAEVEITSADIDRLAEEMGENGAIVADARGGRLVLRFVDQIEAARLARLEGGLPS